MHRTLAAATAAVLSCVLLVGPARADDGDRMFQGFLGAEATIAYASAALQEEVDKKEQASGVGLGVNVEAFRMLGPVAVFVEAAATESIGLTDAEGDSIFAVFGRAHVGYGISDQTGGTTLGVGALYDTLSDRVGGYASWMLFDLREKGAQVREMWLGYYPGESGGLGAGGSWGYAGDGYRGDIFVRLFGAGAEGDLPSGGLLLMGFNFGWGAATMP